MGEMFHRPDPKAAIENFEDGTDRRCRICGGKLSRYNPQDECGPCEVAHGPFDNPRAPFRNSATQLGIVGREGARKREAARQAGTA